MSHAHVPADKINNNKLQQQQWGASEFDETESAADCAYKFHLAIKIGKPNTETTTEQINFTNVYLFTCGMRHTHSDVKTFEQLICSLISHMAS